MQTTKERLVRPVNLLERCSDALHKGMMGCNEKAVCGGRLPPTSNLSFQFMCIGMVDTLAEAQAS